jgi:hypothetical protein
MKHIFYLVIILTAVIYFWPQYDPGKKTRELSELTEVYFNPEKKYEAEESDTNVSVTLRKAATTFQVPINSLVGIYHPYKPWAKEIWDSFSYWVTWPNLGGRDQDNIHLFTKESNSKIIKIHVSTFGLELDSDNYFHKTHKKTGMVKVKSIEQPISNLLRLIALSKNENSNPSYYYQAETDYLTFPSGNPLQIECRVNFLGEEEKKSRLCSVKFVLPIQAWPQKYRYPLLGHRLCNYGIQVKYTFHEDLINNWETLYNRILRDVIGKISYPEITYNKDNENMTFNCGATDL